MKTYTHIRKPLPALGPALLCCMFWSVTAASAPVDCAAPEETGSMSERTYSVLSRAMDEMAKDRLVEAASSLEAITGKVEGYERALVFQTLGHVQAQQDDLSAALHSFEEAIATGGLPRTAHEEMLLNTGQLHLAEGNHGKAIEVIQAYLETVCGTPAPAVHMALASAFAEQEDYPAALNEVLSAISLAPVPEEQWLQFKLALHFELKQYSECAATLLTLLAMTPGNDQYWRQLSGVMLEIEKQDEALAVLALAERQGFLQNEREVRNLANLYLMLEIPYKAAHLLERALQEGKVEATAANYEYLSEAWISAREWAFAETALSEAASRSEDGKLWQRLAQVRMEREDWTNARKALEQAITLGVPDTGEAYYLLGITAYNSQDTAAAVAALQTASTHPSFANEATQWLEFLRTEQRRVMSMAEPAEEPEQGAVQ